MNPARDSRIEGVQNDAKKALPAFTAAILDGIFEYMWEYMVIFESRDLSRKKKSTLTCGSSMAWLAAFRLAVSACREIA